LAAAEYVHCKHIACLRMNMSTIVNMFMNREIKMGGREAGMLISGANPPEIFFIPMLMNNEGLPKQPLSFHTP